MNIQEKRRALGKTQVQMAKEVGVSPETLSRWENNPDKTPKIYDMYLDILYLAHGTPESDPIN